MQEMNKPADALLEAIKQLHKRRDGVTLTSKEVLKEANDVLKERLGL